MAGALSCKAATASLSFSCFVRRMRSGRRPAMRVACAAGASADSSLPDNLCFSAADAAFLRAMALRPQLPLHNIGWDDCVGDPSLQLDSWHEDAWQVWGQAAATADPPAAQPDD